MNFPKGSSDTILKEDHLSTISANLVPIESVVPDARTDTSKSMIYIYREIIFVHA